jgi:cobalt-zinc-cadmium efflux system outer membrane protein
MIRGASAADTLKITLQQADTIFLARNYYLLASAMNIEASKAQVLQAKLYPNPVFTADFNAYDPQHDQAFHVGKTGQKSFQLEQLILLGGKRKAEIDVAKTNVALAELEFKSLVRQLRFRLHTELFTIGQQQVLLKKYNEQLVLLDSILVSFEAQVAKGNIPLKEVVRLKGVYLNLNNDRAELLQQYFASQANVQALLQTDSVVVFSFTDSEITAYIKEKSLAELQAEAQTNQPDLLMMQQNKTLAEQYVRLQKKNAIPDVNLFTSYDQRGGAFVNQINAGVAFNLPVWNRNQGNIKSAKFQLQESNYFLQARQREVSTILQNNLAMYLQTVSEYRKAQELYNGEFEITLKGMSDNFKKRNVSMIEFVDFFESYNQVLAEMARIKTQLVTSAEQLNLTIGKDIY